MSQPAGPTPPNAAIAPTVTFVCVHGIGRQKEGDTADAVAASFADAVRNMNGNFQIDDSGTERGTKSGTLMVADAAHRVRFVDGWWDEDVTPPPATTVLRWMLRVTPFMVVMTVAAWLLDLFVAERSSPRPERMLFSLLGAMGTLLALLFTPLIVVALFVLNVVAVLRPRAWPAVTGLVQSVFGDAWLYRSEGLDATTFPRLNRVLKVARANSDLLYLVGHSQGAEIGRRLAHAVSVDGCVWVGGAMTPLAMARTLRNSPVLPWVLWLYVLSSPLLASMLITTIFHTTGAFIGAVVQGAIATFESRLGDAAAAARADAASQDMWRLLGADLPGLALFLGFCIAMAFVIRIAARPPKDLQLQPECPVMEVKSLADPVCFGSMNPAAVIRYVPIVPGRAAFHEHLTYFNKPATGFALLEMVFGTENVPAPYVPQFSRRTYLVAALGTALLLVGANVVGSALLSALGW